MGRNQTSSPIQARGSVSGPRLCLKANDGDPDASGKREVIPTASSSQSTHMPSYPSAVMSTYLSAVLDWAASMPEALLRQALDSSCGTRMMM